MVFLFWYKESEEHVEKGTGCEEGGFETLCAREQKRGVKKVAIVVSRLEPENYGTPIVKRTMADGQGGMRPKDLLLLQ
jgi:hypothetical protein